MVERLGEQLLTEVKAFSNTRLRSARARRYGVRTTELLYTSVSKPASSAGRKTTSPWVPALRLHQPKKSKHQAHAAFLVKHDNAIRANLGTAPEIWQNLLEIASTWTQFPLSAVLFVCTNGFFISFWMDCFFYAGRIGYCSWCFELFIVSTSVKNKQHKWSLNVNIHWPIIRRTFLLFDCPKGRNDTRKKHSQNSMTTVLFERQKHKEKKYS